MSNKAALITGASSGIGLEIARTLGRLGHDLTVVARRPEKLQEAAAGLAESGYNVQAVPANLAEEEEINQAFAAHRERYGRLDVLVNNAGLGIGRPLEQIEAKHLDMQVAINLRATILGTREGTPMLREAAAEHGSAVIVNTSSFSGVHGQPFLSVYGATKAAIINFSQATQRELGDSGIKVTAICPGFVETAMTEFIREQIPAEKMIRPEDIGAAVDFLLQTSPNCLVPELVMVRQEELSGSMV
ncbi:MAG TPA: SDR family oxidoreductase [Solirubrobacterales bacterium]|nr:SDR family oxidoreductase [Solirubrobacterales bacterium]